MNNIEKDSDKMRDENLLELVNGIHQTGILDAISDAVSILDSGFRIIYQNHAHKTVAGNSLGKNCYEIFCLEKHICEGCPLSESFRDGGIHTLVRKTMVNGNLIYFEITASPVRDQDGNVIAGIEVVRDVTEQRRTEQTLKEAEKKYRSLFETSPDMIFITSRETGIIIDVNESACRLLGYSRDELIGTVSGDRVVSSQKSSYHHEFEKLQTEGVYFGKYDLMRKDGSIMKVEVRGGAFNDYLFAIGRDITQRNIYEEEIKTRVEELENFYEMAIGRETRMMELKGKIEKLKKELSAYEMHCNCEHTALKREPDI